MSRLRSMLDAAAADPLGALLIAFAVAIGVLFVVAHIRLAWFLFGAGWQGRRENRLERLAARRRRPGPNWLAADLRRRRGGAQP